MKKLFLFDLDGTLVSTGGAGLRALDRCFAEQYGVQDVMKKVNPSGKTDPAIFREIVREFLNRDMDPSENEKISGHYLTCLKEEMKNLSKARVHSGVNEFLNHLKSDADSMFGLGTGNLESGARLKLEPFGLNDYFSFGGFGSDAEDRAELLKVGHKKAERIYKDVILPQNVYIIGDTVLDISAARRAGFRVIAVATGGVSCDTLAQAKPDYLWDTMSEGLNFKL